MEKLNKYTNTAHIAKTNEIVEEINQLKSGGGKINSIKVNNNPLPISPEDKSVNIDLSGYSSLRHSHRADEVVGLEQTYAHIAHNHTTADVRDLDTKLSSMEQEIALKVGVDHSHSKKDVIGLENDLNNKANKKHTHAATEISGLEQKFAPISHNHAMSQITGLDTALAGKSPIKHSHEIADIIRLNDELSKKAAASHSHAATEVTGLANVAKTGNYSDLKNAPTSLSSFTNDTNYITKNSNITGNAATATKATQDSLGNTIKDTYAKKDNIYLYVGKNPVVSELNENTIVIDPDEVNNGTAKPIIDAYTKAESDQKFVSKTEAGNIYLTKTNANTTYATKTENNSKANKSTSLSGYGIKDAYTKDQVDMYLEDRAGLTTNNAFSASNTFNQKIEQGVRGFTTANINTIRDNQTDFILLNAENNTAITINAAQFFGDTSNTARVCCVLIYGSGAPVITWTGCTLFCEAPKKTAGKKTLITFLVNGQDRNLVSVSYEA